MKTKLNTPIPSDSAAAMRIIRAEFPAMRRTSATAIIRSGGRRTVFGCLCGSRHTCSTDWRGRETKHVREWRALHEACALRLAADLLAGREVSVHFGSGC